MHRTLFQVTALFLFALLACPSTSRASIWDLIWSLSGPQMHGIPVHCEFALGDTASKTETAQKRYECRVLDIRFTGDVKSRSERKTWLSLDMAPYWSTGKNPREGLEFGAGKVKMAAIEPILEVRSWPRRDNTENAKVMLHHGLIGATYDVLWGEDFETFDKFGFKFKPVGITSRSVECRSYATVVPQPVHARRVRKEPSTQDVKGSNEVAFGFSVGYLFRR